jgi:glycosyltransferase involved in cell wall biosynthesis
VKLLFVHQNFPGQYRRMAPFFAGSPRNQVVSISERHADRPINFPRIRHLLYDAPKGASGSTHHYLRGVEASVRRGQAAVKLAIDLRKSGFVPEVICAHPGWGEALYLKEVFPKAKLLNYYEFFYRYKGADVGFDPEYPSSLDDMFKTPTRNATQLLSFVACDAGISPTAWQKSLYPPFWRDHISVIHEGVDTRAIRPDAKARLALEKTPGHAALELTPADEVLTYVSRNLEPYRGFHVFMRALPEILRRRPAAQVLVVGGDEVSYGQAAPAGTTYRQKLLAEVGADLDLARVRFLGKIPYPRFLKLLQVSTAHVYLTYPFVLSWSMLEAMASGCLVIGSRTPPVEEVLEDGVNGLLVDFPAPPALAARVVEALEAREALQPLRARARQSIVERYDLQSICLPQHVALIRSLADGSYAGPA